MLLPTLFSRTSTGATQTWTIEVEGAKYRTVSGQLEGKKTTSKWTECQGKYIGQTNETTPEQQAMAEALAKHKKKLESNYFEDVSKIDELQFIEPMLAKKFEDYVDELEFPVWSQPKLDGIRCVTRRGSMMSRGGKPFVSCPHILKELEPLFKLRPQAILDGELYTNKYNNDFNEICSLIKRTKCTPEHLAAAEASIEYWVYDYISEGHLPFADRHKQLVQDLVEAGVTGTKIILVPTMACKTMAELDALYEAYMSDGYEGQIVRKNQPYEYKRTDALLKRKEFQDGEWEILNVVEGTGNRSGTVGYFEFKTHDGVEFRSNIKGNMVYLAELLLQKDELIGKTATIKYFNLTPDGVPRFPYVVAIRDYE